MGKKYDSEKILEFIEKLEEVVGQYKQRAGLLGDAYDKYENNETHVGLAAEASKKFVSGKQVKFNIDQIEIHRKLVKLYIEIDELFKTMVDSSAIARIDTDVLKEIKEIFQKYKIPFDNKSTEIEEKASELQSKFGQYGNFTQPSFRRARDVCNEFCGDGKFLDQIVKNFEEFDQESCTYVDRSGIEQFVDEYTSDVGRTAKALDEAEVYDPHINDVFVDIVSMGAAVGINQLNNSLLKEDALNEFYESLRNSPLYTEAIMRRYKTAERIIKMSVPFSQEYIDTWLLNEDNKLAYLVVKQKLNPETDQGIMSFLESIDNRNKAIKWLDPNYKMTDEEVKKAKEIAEAELAKMEKSVATYEFQNIYNERYSVNYDEKLRELSEKEKIEYANYEIFRLLEDKTNPALSFMRGVKGYGIPIKKFFDGVDAEISGTLREMTGAQTLSDTYQGIEDVDKKYARIALDKQNAMTQHQVATTTANAIIDTALYFATSGMLQAYGLTEGMSATAAFATNQYAQFVQDATISYMPHYLEYASDGVITDSEKRAFLNEVAVGELANLTLGTLDVAVKMRPTSSTSTSLDMVKTEYDSDINLKEINMTERSLNSSYKAPKITTNSRGELTNGKFVLDAEGMVKHTDGTVGKSQFLFDVDANKAVLDAAAYADENNLWGPSSGNPLDFADKAKVFVENGPVGITGSGELTNYINIYRTKTGYVHGCPGNP